jgi:hypothetical protein
MNMSPPIICSVIIFFSSRHYPGGIHFANFNCYGSIIWQFAIPMPFVRNGVNSLYFQSKSECLKSQPFNSLVRNTLMCYSNVTSLPQSLLVLANKSILLEF